MDALPPEILEHILGSGWVNVGDILNCAATCKHLKSTIENSDYLWKRFYRAKYRRYADLLDNETTAWFAEVQYIYALSRRIRKMLLAMPDKFYVLTHISDSDLKDWLDLSKERPVSYPIVMEQLQTVIHQKCGVLEATMHIPLLTPGHKTTRYYAVKVLQFLKKNKLTKGFHELMELPEKQRTAERIACFIAQWCQPLLDFEYKSVCRALNKLARDARAVLKLHNPQHPLFKLPDETVNRWIFEAFDEHKFDKRHCHEIIEAINYVLYVKHDFGENRLDFYDLNNSFINVVLECERGLPILLCIVYEGIARRLGVNCEPVSIPSHFLLRFRQGAQGSPSVYLNAAYKGQMYPSGGCPFQARANPAPAPSPYPRADSIAVMLRMTANMEDSLRQTSYATTSSSPLRAVLELNVLIAPHHFNHVLALSRLYMTLNMDARHLEAIITDNNSNYNDPHGASQIVQMLRDYEVHRQTQRLYEQLLREVMSPVPFRLPFVNGCGFQLYVPTKRPPGMRYGVGQPVQHRKLGYTGIITDWTPECKASGTWQRTMHVHTLERKGHQPFYYVLVADVSYRYVAEDNIIPLTNINDLGNTALFDSVEVGRHFSHWCSAFFVPNAEKERQYPEDNQYRGVFTGESSVPTIESAELLLQQLQ